MIECDLDGPTAIAEDVVQIDSQLSSVQSRIEQTELLDYKEKQ